MNTRAMLDPLFLTTLLGSLAMLGLFVRFLIDDIDLEADVEPASPTAPDIEPRRPQDDGTPPRQGDGRRPRRAA